jgi:hypothetical protein
VYIYALLWYLNFLSISAIPCETSWKNINIFEFCRTVSTDRVHLKLGRFFLGTFCGAQINKQEKHFFFFFCHIVLVLCWLVYYFFFFMFTIDNRRTVKFDLVCCPLGINKSGTARKRKVHLTFYSIYYNLYINVSEKYGQLSTRMGCLSTQYTNRCIIKKLYTNYHDTVALYNGKITCFALMIINYCEINSMIMILNQKEWISVKRNNWLVNY